MQQRWENNLTRLKVLYEYNIKALISLMRQDVIYLRPGFIAQSLLVLPFLCAV